MSGARFVRDLGLPPAPCGAGTAGPRHDKIRADLDPERSPLNGANR
jgi:hypothetical protein